MRTSSRRQSLRVKHALLLAAALSACAGAVFTISVDDQATATIAQGSIVEQLVDDLGFGAFNDIDVTDSEELANQGVEPGDIDGVYLMALDVRIVSPDGADFDFVDTLEFDVVAPGLPAVLLASSRPIEDGATRIEFDIEDIDLTDYATSTSMTFNSRIRGRRPSQDVTVEASYVLDVGVTQQGCNKAVRGE